MDGQLLGVVVLAHGHDVIHDARELIDCRDAVAQVCQHRLPVVATHERRLASQLAVHFIQAANGGVDGVADFVADVLDDLTVHVLRRSHRSISHLHGRHD